MKREPRMEIKDIEGHTRAEIQVLTGAPKKDVRGVEVDFWYPNRDHPPPFVQLGLCDVRAADHVRIHFDFKRDGWVISQQPTVEYPGGGYIHAVGPYEETAFVRAWHETPGRTCPHSFKGDVATDFCDWCGSQRSDIENDERAKAKALK